MSQVRRRQFISCLVAVLVTPLVQAQQPQVAVVRVGFLFAGTLAQRPQAQAFWQGLRELGYIEGKNIEIDIREARGNVSTLPQLAAELVEMKPALLVAVTTAAAAAARRVTRSIPIVMINVGDPVGAGFTNSLARPSGNMTGVSNTTGELPAKQLQLLRELLPSATRIAVLWNPRNPAHVDMLNRLKTSAPSLGVELQPIAVQVPGELGSALASGLQKRCDALFVVADALHFERRSEIIAFAAAQRVPTIHTFPEEALDGGLMSYGTNLTEHYRSAATYVDRILKGAKPADLPIKQPTTFELIVNLRTAKALGLTVPPSLILRADRVIE